MAINEDKLNKLLEQAVTDFGAAWHTALVVIGDRLGLYRAMAEHGPVTPEELAAKTNTTERYMREWLASQAAGGYVDYDAGAGRFSLSEEQATMLVDENSPAFIHGAFQGAIAGVKILDKVEQAFRTGQGLAWHEQDAELFEATDRLFRPNYQANLVSSWIPALEGVETKLKAGARVADVGCGFGSSTVLMAQAYPNSAFVGFDFHEPSLERAQKKAQAAGVSDRVSFNLASAQDYPGQGFDLVTFFDCLHDMGDPAGAAAHVLETLDKDGTWMIVEPFAEDRLEENLNPLGRAFYSISSMVCTPCSLDQETGRALGAQAGEARIREVAQKGGFTRFRKATQTPFNLIFEARP